MKDRIRRADLLRPHVKMLVDEGSVRSVASASGINRTVLHDFVTGKTPQEENLKKLEAWADRVGIVKEAPARYASAPPSGNADLARQIDRAQAEPGDVLAKSYYVGEIRAAYRDAALRDLAAALLKAEENVARLSEERKGHRDALLKIDENATVRAREVGRPPPLGQELPLDESPDVRKGTRKTKGA